MSWLNTSAAFIPRRRIGSWEATVTIEESAQDDLEITQHPVQDGAAITDHAYKKPVTLTVMAQYTEGASGVPVDEMYRRLLSLQESREPIDVITGKRMYSNMLIKSVSETTDKDTSKVLNVTASLQEIIVVTVATVEVPAKSQKRSAQKEPERTAGIEDGGVKKAAPAGERRTSALRDLFGG